MQVKETVGGIMGSAEEATSDTASKAVDQVCALCPMNEGLIRREGL